VAVYGTREQYGHDNTQLSTPEREEDVAGATYSRSVTAAVVQALFFVYTAAVSPN
jgi:hypothetical protein